MIKTVDHYVAQSLKEFLNWKALSSLGAFSEKTSTLSQRESEFQGFDQLNSSYAGFVYDSDFGIVPEISGAKIDYRNGRFLAPSGISFSGEIILPVSDFNFYITSSSDSNLVFETKPFQTPVNSSGYIPADSIVAPCVFVKNFSSEGEEHTLGGESSLNWIFRIVCLARRESELIGIQKIIRSSKTQIFPYINEDIFDEYGSLRVPGWSYQSEIDEMADYCLIQDSTFKIAELDVFTDGNPKMFVGIGNVEVSYFSQPR